MQHSVLLIILILLVIGLVLEVFWFVSVLQSIAGGAPFISLSRKRAREAWAAVGLQPGEVIYELGCGDARHLVYACRQYLVAGVGIDISWWPLMWAWLRIGLSGMRRRVRLIWRNIHKVNLSNADVVYLYLGQKLSDSLREKFRQELKPGSRIISVQFPLTDWQPTNVIGDAQHPTYIYRI
ncbi:class I SAM-dependent methyltransferase [Patescibacteria group bacterium]|nr:class I SAM-dependent methyltransferase [Patescibacteria group bacterium]